LHIFIIIIIINCRDNQHQTTMYKTYHEKATDVVDEGGWRISVGQGRRHHERNRKKKKSPSSSIYCMINDSTRASYQSQCLLSELWNFLLECK
jgi:hypothetical protein